MLEEEGLKIGGEEYEDRGCYSVKGGSIYERKRRVRYCSPAHVGGGEVKKRGGEED